MNRKETEVLALIRKNPYLTQQDMAQILEMSRPSLANLISGLMRQGKIAGRAYVLPEEKTVVCIGGANVDRKFRMENPVQMGTSNPASVTRSVGGVARNVAENLGRLGHQVKLMSIAGNDPEWQLIEESSSTFMNCELTKSFDEFSTGTYTAILEPNGEMVLAMADMAIYDELTPVYVARNENALFCAAYIIIDLNCPKETVQYVRELAKLREIPLAVIPVSGPKMNRLGDDLSGITWLILNRDEAESYLDQPIHSMEEWKAAAAQFLKLGVQNIVITGGGNGVVAGSHEEIIHYDPIPVETVVDVTGAGDAFSSGLLHGALNEELIADSVRSGLLNASKTLQSDTTVRSELSAILLQKELEELQ